MPEGSSNNEASNQTQPEEPLGPRLWAIASNSSTLKAVRLLLLAAAYSPVSQLCLSPVYGSVPSGVYHRKGLMATALLTWVAKDRLRRVLPASAINFLPAIAFWIPTIQFALFKQSSLLGQPWGPLVTESLTYFPLVFLSIYAAAAYFDQVDLTSFGELVAEHGPAVGSYALFSTAQKFFTTVITSNIRGSGFQTRAGHQLILAVLYALTLPSTTFLPLAIPSLIFSLTSNPHIPLLRTTNLLNSTLSAHNFTLLERTESLTGYLSVLENTQQGFRVMRCDHSLLGGEWTSPSLYQTRNAQVREPVYTVFAMLEAVRLVERDDGKPRPPDSETTALNIGLGIGTTPHALLLHNITTTIVEIDLAVHQLATKYFALPTNHSAAIVDATAFVAGAVHHNSHPPTPDTPKLQYDYIIHDVFTGGAEPLPLFTFEFLSQLKSLLKTPSPNGDNDSSGDSGGEGVIAINYAGDLLAPPAAHVIHTVHAVFPRCRMFREDAGPSASASSPKKNGAKPATDFTNLVIFCKATASSTSPPLTFRPLLPSDTLGSRAREMFLPPKYEVPFDDRFASSSHPLPPGAEAEAATGSSDAKTKGRTKGREKGRVDPDMVLRRADAEQKMEKYAVGGAVGHWRLMREVLPREVWEAW